jgi:hypothetical protein
LAEKLNRTFGVVRDHRKFIAKAAVGHAPQPFRMEVKPRDHYDTVVGHEINSGTARASSQTEV